MKRLFVLLICFASIFGVSAQETDIMLKGGVEQQNYFTVVPYTSVGGLPIIKVKISGKEYRFRVPLYRITEKKFIVECRI